MQETMFPSNLGVKQATRHSWRHQLCWLVIRYRRHTIVIVVCVKRCSRLTLIQWDGRLQSRLWTELHLSFRTS
jgi:hypothetical protein